MNARGLDLTIERLTVVYGGVTALDDVQASRCPPVASSRF